MVATWVAEESGEHAGWLSLSFRRFGSGRDSLTSRGRRTACLWCAVCCVANLQGAIFTFVYLEVIAPDSVTNWFNRAHGRVRSDPQCVRLLGGGTIKAYGEETWSRWARNRPIA